MQLFKITATILIFGGGIAGAYLIIKNSQPEISSANLNSLKQPIENLISENPFKWLDNISATSSLGTANLSDFQNNQILSDQQSLNFTKMTIQSIFSQAQAISQNDSNSVATLNPDDPEVRASIQETLKSFPDPFSVFYQPIDENNLKVINDNSIESQIKYYENYQRIINSAFGSFKKDSAEILNDVFKRNDFSSVRKVEEIYKTLTDNFIKLAVPSSLLEFHKKIIQHYQNSYMIYQAVSQYSQDPIKTYLAVQAIPQLYSETEDIQNLFKKILEERAEKFNL